MRSKETTEPAARIGSAAAKAAPGDGTLTTGQAMYRRFLRAWIPAMVVLVVLEIIGAPFADRPQMITVVVFTALAGVGGFLAALGLSREQTNRMPLVATALVDVAGVLTGLLSAAGNDAAIMLPFIGGVLLMAALVDRELLAGFVFQWLVGMVGAVCAYGFSDLRNVPNHDPIYVSLASSAVITFAGYTLLWWVRDRLNRAVDRAQDAEQAATRSAHELEALVRSSPVPTIGLDLDGTIRTWNPAAETVFGWQADEIVGRDAAVLAAGTDPDAPAGVVERVLRGEVVRGSRVQWRARDGATLAVDLHAALLRDAVGQPSGVVTQAIDETEREALRARLAGAERLETVGRLAGGIAHDFNNLLTAVAGYAELLQADLPENDPRHHDASEIGRAAGRGTDLVRHLLAFGRRQPIRPVVVDLDGLLAGLLPMIGRLIGSQVRIRVERGAEPCFVRADRGQLEQVVVNLAVNARDAMPGGGVLEIRTQYLDGGAGPRARLTVSDTGVGMDPATAARVFEPFFSTKAPGSGNGLGLATVYGIVTAHGGTVEVRTQPGRGTSFIVDLPSVADVAPDEDDPGDRIPLPPIGGSETILIIDDEAQVRRVAARALERCGYRVLQAGDRATALAVATAEPGRIDLALSDVVMPDVRGPVLVRQLRPIHPEMRTLYMTGYAAESGRAPNVSDLDGPVIAKPFTLGDLATVLRRTLDEPATEAVARDAAIH
jgi:hypothetical protein